MLVSCPECSLQVSDKAIACPHCGYPMQPSANINKTRRKRRRRLPNGFGQISKINDPSLRNCYRAMVTVGKNEFGKPICKILKPKGYFATYNDAYAALLEYNRHPYDLSADITMQELFDLWYGPYTQKLSLSSGDGIRNAWKYCGQIYDVKVRDVRIRHLKQCIDHAEKNGIPATPSIKYRIKYVFNVLFDYALELELVDRNYAKEFTLSKEVTRQKAEEKKGHIPFTDEEMEKLWNCDLEYKSLILIQCYSGWRPREMLAIKTSDVDLDNWTFTGGSKTSAGRNRTVPIHTKIRELVKAEYNPDNKYLFEGVNYDKYRYHFKSIIQKLGLNPDHRPHDPRVHFVTMAKKYKVDEYVIKRLVGHSIDDVTEAAYTKRDMEWIRDEMEKIR